MKKMFAIMATLMIAMTACADRHEMVQYTDLPAAAQSFVQKYYSVNDVSYVEQDRDGFNVEYKVYLKNRTEIEFNHQGNLKSIDCQNSSVPEGIVPTIIVSYVNLHHPDMLIVEYHIEHRRLKVELSNGWELIFDLEGNFLGIDD
jgi:hypothetical protein